MSKGNSSAVIIARLLDTEGFSDFVANQVERYWRNKSGLTERQKRSIARLDKEISRIAQTLPEGDRLIYGKFIGLHKKMSFDVGLRIGLQAFAQQQDKIIDLDVEPLPTNGEGDLLKAITGALRSCIDAHGPIDKRQIGSAAKRIAGVMKGKSKNEQ